MATLSHTYNAEKTNSCVRIRVSIMAAYYRKAGKTYVICSSNGNAILIRMPAHVQDLLVKVDLIRVGLLLHAPAHANGAACSGPILLSIRTLVHRRWDANLLRLESRLICLQYDLRLLARVGGVDHEVVVVTSSHHVLCVARENNLELVENAVILICVTQTRSQVLVDGDRFDGLLFHVDIPDLNSQVIPRHNVATVV